MRACVCSCVTTGNGLTYSLTPCLLSEEHKLQNTCLHPALSCTAATSFLLLEINSASAGSGHVAIDPDQIGLVAADNRTRANHRYKFRTIGASSTGLRYSFAVRTVSDWNQLPAVVVEQENPAAFKAQLARCAPVRMPLPTTTISVILHEEDC